jgi:DNA-binding transcriptional regulator YdaS (Cro superfamily)
MTPTKPIKLTRFIEKTGDKAFCALTGATPSQAKTWRLGTRRPKGEMAQVIIEKTKGAVTLKGIYG